MRVVLVGGGKVGSYLARELHRGGHVVMVIEENPLHAGALTDATKVLVLEGDGTDVTLLKGADAHRADWVLAVTGLDEVNLVACQLALTIGARHVLARLNNPLNRPTFDALGIPVVAVTDLIATLISRELEISDLKRIALLGRGRISVYEVDVPPGFEARPVAEIRLPKGSLLVTLLRENDVFVPTATTWVRPGDQVIALSSMDLETEVRAVLGHAEEKHR